MSGAEGVAAEGGGGLKGKEGGKGIRLQRRFASRQERSCQTTGEVLLDFRAGSGSVSRREVTARPIRSADRLP